MSDIQCNIAGVVIRKISPLADHRGWLAELFRHDELPLEYHPVMGYISLTEPGITRGPHEHRTQTDYICFLGTGNFRLYLWDNRPQSPTFFHKCQMDIPSDNQYAVLIPPHVVHAYKNIGTSAGLVANFPNRLYGGENRHSPVDEIRHEENPDSAFKIE